MLTALAHLSTSMPPACSRHRSSLANPHSPRLHSTRTHHPPTPHHYANLPPSKHSTAPTIVAALSPITTLTPPSFLDDTPPYSRHFTDTTFDPCMRTISTYNTLSRICQLMRYQQQRLQHLQYQNVITYRCHIITCLHFPLRYAQFTPPPSLAYTFYLKISIYMVILLLSCFILYLSLHRNICACMLMTLNHRNTYIQPAYIRYHLPFNLTNH